MNDLKTRKSKYIALLLRHKPEEGDLVLDREGYCNVNNLIKAVKRKFGSFTLEELEDIVSSDEKGRYSFNETKSKIRANQGHSTSQVNISFKEVVPPEILYHGTATRFLESIYKDGIKSMSRQYVHLSKDIETATKVGSRHGTAFIIKINANQMYKDGYKFYISDNGVYLTESVPKKYFMV